MKMYDRRFASALRESYKYLATPIASVAEEEEFQQLVSWGNSHKATTGTPLEETTTRNGSKNDDQNGDCNKGHTGGEVEGGEEDALESDSDSITPTPDEDLCKIHEHCLQLHSAECAVYSRLQDL